MYLDRQLRIGISTRIVNACDYNESRDALSHDWYSFIQNVFPKALWMLVPNLGQHTPNFLSRWNLNGFIISGGGNYGSESLRDESELAIIDYAITHKHPILGVCRGLQLMVHKFGGKIEQTIKKEHVATTHSIRATNNPIGYKAVNLMKVNSYHDNVITDAGRMVPFAFDEQRNIEAAYSKEHRLAAIMWHPERSNPTNMADVAFLRCFFGEQE